MRNAYLTLALVLLAFALAAVWVARQRADPVVTCTEFDTSAPLTAAAADCWNSLSAQDVLICPTDAHPDWLTAIAPHCPN